MTRGVSLALVLGSLVAAPGCSCLGGGMGRTSFMEFRSPCRRQGEPCGMPAAAPACGPACAPACEPAPCCGEGGAVMSAPVSTPVVSAPGTFS
ncbi:MAG: hypothetical protein ACKOSQ_12375 [Planctomycetaceae bacterium]